MANLNTEEIKKLKKGELWGVVALIGAGVSFIATIVLFVVAVTLDIEGLRNYGSLLAIPIAIFTATAAVCNLTYGRALDRIIKNYVQEVLIENASLMHPERDSLTYYISNEGNEFFIKANNFKEIITLDFSAFGKLSLSKKATVTTAIVERLGATFCKLLERGGKYKNVSYCAVKDGKQGKIIYIIENGAPDKKAYKNYLKQK